MTREEILALKPGHELDLLVTEKVIGVAPWEPYQYSTDMSDAWKVVEKFPIVNISRVEVFENFPHHAVEILSDMETNEPSRAEARTAPEAICKAALLAVMEVTA